jgi:hypothetical protein
MLRLADCELARESADVRVGSKADLKPRMFLSPLYPRQQTSSRRAGMSGWYQQRKSKLLILLIDYVVGTDQHPTQVGISVSMRNGLFAVGLPPKRPDPTDEGRYQQGVGVAWQRRRCRQ